MIKIKEKMIQEIVQEMTLLDVADELNKCQYTIEGMASILSKVRQPKAFSDEEYLNQNEMIIFEDLLEQLSLKMTMLVEVINKYLHAKSDQNIK